MRIARRVDAGGIGFHDGLLVALVEALKSVVDGDIIALTSDRDDVNEGLQTWSRLTGHSIVAASSKKETTSQHEWLLRKGAPAGGGGGATAIGSSSSSSIEAERPIGSRLWLYTNFDCNLRCDYCCARSTPEAPRRALELPVVKQIASEARDLGFVDTIFLTGGEPFLLPDIQAILETCASVAPTTVLTNGTLFFSAKSRETLDSVPKDRIYLQISIDSEAPELHDLHRGAGTFRRAWRGVVLARELGFRVRLAATVSSDQEEAALHGFFEKEGIPPEDRVIRRIALRGFASDGVALASSDLLPEVTLTSRGVYWHPVGADDDDFFVTADHFPLRAAVDAVRARWESERAIFGSLAQIFHCA